MIVVFEALARPTMREPWSGRSVEVVELVGETKGGLPLFLVTADDGTSFGAYGDELILVPESGRAIGAASGEE